MISAKPPGLICPSCGCRQIQVFYEAAAVPVNSVLLLSNIEQARAIPTGEVRLGFCQACGFIYNTAFKSHLVEYSTRCEETQGFSPFFKRWHESLARRLIERHSLRGKKVVEIGCGKGEFLSLLCELGDNYGIGFDPAYVPGRATVRSLGCIQFVPEFYTQSNSDLTADFVCCKMTLEHIVDPAVFVRRVRGSLRRVPDASVFFQVPDVSRVLEEEAFWDVYYEHCSYFAVPSLMRLFRSAGFGGIEMRREYGDQYVTVEGSIGGEIASACEARGDVTDLKRLVTRFAGRVPRNIARWRKRLGDYREKGRKTVIWGAGSKGVTFAATLDVPGSIRYAVDINPHMSRHYLAKSGLEIVTPSVLSEYRPDTVIVMNPIYRDEIIATLKDLGLHPEVISAGTNMDTTRV